jgi:hypothetical protein
MPFSSKRKSKTQSVDRDALQWDDVTTLPAVGGQPARNIISKTPHRIVGGLELPDRAPYALDWESFLERVCILTLAMSQDVDWIASQPTELRFELNGSSARYFPDLLIRGKFGECYVEVKPLAVLVEPENLSRYAKIAAQMRTEEKRLVFLTDEQILGGDRTSNVMLMRRYISGSLDEDCTAAVRNSLKDCAMPIQQLMRDTNVDLRTVYTMIARRQLVTDWERVIAPCAEVALPSSDRKGLRFEHILSSGRFGDLLAQLAMGHRPTDKRELALAKAHGQPLRKPASISTIGDFPRDKHPGRIYEPVDVFRKPFVARSRRTGARASDSQSPLGDSK